MFYQFAVLLLLLACPKSWLWQRPTQLAESDWTCVWKASHKTFEYLFKKFIFWSELLRHNIHVSFLFFILSFFLQATSHATSDRQIRQTIQRLEKAAKETASATTQTIAAANSVFNYYSDLIELFLGSSSYSSATTLGIIGQRVCWYESIHTPIDTKNKGKPICQNPCWTFSIGTLIFQK